MATKPVKPQPARRKLDLDVKHLQAMRRDWLIEALEKVSQPISPEQRVAAAAMLRDDATPRRAVRVADSEFAQYAVFIWRKLKRYAVKKGRGRWNDDQRKLAATTSITIAETVYPTQRGKLKPATLLKLIDQPQEKKVKRKGDDVVRIELRNAALIQHFESLPVMQGFMFNAHVPAATRKALTA